MDGEARNELRDIQNDMSPMPWTLDPWHGVDQFKFYFNYPCLIAKARYGSLLCGYFDIHAFDDDHEVAAIVTGVYSFEDMLKAKIVKVSGEAHGRGIREGMTGREALDLMRTYPPKPV